MPKTITADRVEEALSRAVGRTDRRFGAALDTDDPIEFQGRSIMVDQALGTARRLLRLWAMWTDDRYGYGWYATLLR